MSDWSKIVFSQASDALTEAKQLVGQAMSQNDLDPQNIDWSKVSDKVLSRASDALIEAKQLVNQAASQNDIDLQNVDWSRLSGNVVSRASDALTDSKQLVNQAMSQKNVDLTNIDWSKVSGKILSHASSALALARQMVDQVFIYRNWNSAMEVMSQQYQEKLRPFIEAIPNMLRNHWANILSSALFALTEINNWSISHPYKSAGALLSVSAFTNPTIVLASSQLTGTTAVFMCFLPVRLITWCFGFRSGGIAKGSLASLYQSSHYGGYVLRSSGFAVLQSFGATAGMLQIPLTLISLLLYAGAVTVLGREWGWWLQ